MINSTGVIGYSLVFRYNDQCAAAGDGSEEAALWNGPDGDAVQVRPRRCQALLQGEEN